MRASEIGGYSRRQFIRRGALFVSASALLPRIARATVTGPLSHTVAQATGAATSFTTSAMATTGASLIVMVLKCSVSTDITTLTISESGAGSNNNIWRTLTVRSGASPIPKTVIRYAYNSASGALQTGASHTFTVGTALVISGAVSSWAGTLTTGDPYEGHENGASQSTVNGLSTGTITPSVNGCLIISGAALRSQITYTSTLTLLDRANWASGTATGIAASYQIQTTAASVSTAWTMNGGSGTGEESVSIAAFKSDAAATTPVRRRIIQ